MSVLTPYRGKKWDKFQAAHLLNRAGFGPLPAEIDRAVTDGLEKTVDGLLDFSKAGDYPPPSTPEMPDRPKKLLAGLTPDEQKKKREEIVRQNRDAIDDIRAWWIKRMLNSAAPLQEKLTLFWHGHFTSSIHDVKAARHMLMQNELFRKHALSDFRTLLVEISKDPAMLRYLDNNTNRRQRPNENYARELMELFTMGIGNYTEDDVKAAARAFTGWTFQGDEFVFERFNHDDGVKTFLGKTGAFDGADAIDVILEQPCTGRFMANKLLKFFVTDDPDPAVVEEISTALRANWYDFKPVLRALFCSDYFYSAKVYRTQIKSPVQLIVGSVRLLEASLDEHAMAIVMRGLGQDLFAPPNVKGWDGGEAWVNTTTLLQRYNFAGYLLGGDTPGSSPGRYRQRLGRFAKPTQEMTKLVGEQVAGEAAKLVDVLVARLLQTKIDPKSQKWLLNRAETTRISERPVAVAHLIMSMPEYQLC